jgi:hypothetical protein
MSGGNPNHDPKNGEFTTGVGLSAAHKAHTNAAVKAVTNHSMHDHIKQLNEMQSRLDADATAAGAKLRAFPRGPTGLAPDHVKATAEYKAAKAASDAATTKYRNFNGSLSNATKKAMADFRRGRK